MGSFIKWSLRVLTDSGKRCCSSALARFFRGDIEIDEDINDFDEVLTKSDRRYTLAEVLNSEMFGINTMLPHSYEKLLEIEATDGKKIRKLSGIHTYDILRIPAYAEAFQYYSADLPDRDDFIIDDDDNDDNNNAQSDLVRIVLNLAYFKPYMIDEIDLSADGLQKMAGTA